ncbi:hypothetical protein CRG98_030962 [Punica granatum]|uniref:Uncharacterized protein n=1 Tax=Punica granatum TaxID=22663 RepID=A0A2I0IXB3_PUNGR|nr:hypothetical protein CRG98_030962 [Punica granatum]
MATNMIELMALLRDQNRASVSYIPPPKNRQTMDPNPAVPPTFVSKSEEVVPAAPLINFLPKMETVQERRLKKKEETIKALQAGSSRFDYGDYNWNLFLGMRLPPKIKIPYFTRYDRTRDP